MNLILYQAALSDQKNDFLQMVINLLCTVLTEKYHFSVDIASEVTTRYLQSFVLCPHNPEYDIAQWRILLWAQALQEHASLAEEIYSTWLNLRYRCLALSPDIAAMLRRLRRSCSLALITNGTSASQWEKVDRLKLRGYFDCIVVSGDLPWEKPDKNIFLHACELLSVQPENCIMVGDKLETDILGGKQANLAATVWISAPDSPRPFLSQLEPDFTLASALEVVRLMPLRKFPRSLPDTHDINSNSSDGS